MVLNGSNGRCRKTAVKSRVREQIAGRSGAGNGWRLAPVIDRAFLVAATVCIRMSFCTRNGHLCGRMFQYSLGLNALRACRCWVVRSRWKPIRMRQAQRNEAGSENIANARSQASFVVHGAQLVSQAHRKASGRAAALRAQTRRTTARTFCNHLWLYYPAV